MLLVAHVATRELVIPPKRIKAPFRVIVIGFDGMDADLTERWMAEGKLPNLQRLALDNDRAGLVGYSALHSSNPSNHLSPGPA